MPASLPYQTSADRIVNLASECGLAFQYPGLEALYHRYRDRGLVMLAFPSDDFWQEPNDNARIAQVCAARGLTFPVVGRSHVRGDQLSPVYACLAETGDPPCGPSRSTWWAATGVHAPSSAALGPPDSRPLAAAIERALEESVGLETGAG